MTLQDYKRLVSYMYNYENKAKKNNVGYARVEARNGLCKITIHISESGLESRQLKAYMFYRVGTEMKCISLGYLNVKSSVAECRLQTNSEDIMESGYRLSEISGIVVSVSSDKYYGTEWDDKPIVLNSIVLSEGRPVQGQLEVPEKENLEAAEIMKRMEQNNPIQELMEQNDQTEQKEQQTEAKTIESKSLWKPPLEKEQTQTVQEEAAAGLVEESQESAEKENSDTEETIHNNACENEERKVSQADQIFLRYPRMYPFEDDEIIDCVRIEPQDIGIFPMENWVYANNSFLLHSYYSYRHLIYAKKKEGNGVQYILGVPGIYHNREQFMARMFGFYNFKPIRNREHKTGEFGYWYFTLVL